MSDESPTMQELEKALDEQDASTQALADTMGEVAEAEGATGQ